MNFYEYIISLIGLKTKKKFQCDENFTCLKFFFLYRKKNQGETNEDLILQKPVLLKIPDQNICSDNFGENKFAESF